jgi:hypothetical protein
MKSPFIALACAAVLNFFGQELRKDRDVAVGRAQELHYRWWLKASQS